MPVTLTGGATVRPDVSRSTQGTIGILVVAALLSGCGGPLITERKDENGLTALMRAARAPDTTLLVQLIAKGADVNAQVPRRDLRDGMTYFRQIQELQRSTVGFTALHFAAQSRRLDNVRVLLANGADARLTSNGNWTALHFAVNQDQVEMTRLLARAGAQPDPLLAGRVVSKKSPAMVEAIYANRGNANQAAFLNGERGMRPLLILAVQRGDPDVVRALLKAGANLSARDIHGWTALRWAHEGKARKQPGAAAIVALLDSAGARDDGGLRALDLTRAIARKDVAGVRAALAAGASPNTRDAAGIRPLIHAVTSRDTAIVRALIDAGAALDYATPGSATPLTAAITAGDVAMAKLLLDAGARGDKRDGLGMVPLLLTATNGHTDIARLILRDSTIPVTGYHLGAAASSGDSVLVHLMLDRNADVNYGNGYALYAAARGCSEHDTHSAIALLLARGFKPVDRPYGSIMHTAAERCPPETVTMLLKAGASLNTQDFRGATPLVYAVQKGRLENVQALLAAKADLTIRTRDGMTAVDYARKLEIRKALIAAGASPALRTERSPGGVRGLLARLR